MLIHKVDLEEKPNASTSHEEWDAVTNMASAASCATHAPFDPGSATPSGAENIRHVAEL